MLKLSACTIWVGIRILSYFSEIRLIYSIQSWIHSPHLKGILIPFRRGAITWEGLTQVSSLRYIIKFQTWNSEFSTMSSAMGCPYYYDTRICEFPPEEDNYAIYLQYDTTRKAIHVGDLCFNCQSGAVYNSMLDDFMRSQRDDVEYLMDRYDVLIYNGNFDM